MTRVSRAPWVVLSGEKRFAGPWLGNRTLHKLGLHPARIALADLLLAVRRRQRSPLGCPRVLAPLHRDGVAVLEGFLPAKGFDALAREVRSVVERTRQRVPYPPPEGRGFRPKRPFDGGFDRYDGGTLNRFVAIERRSLPLAHAFVRSPELAKLASYGVGFRNRPDRYWIHEIIHGDEARIPDLQKALHKDTFHSAIKLWFFLDPARLEDGPFTYVPGSHRMTRARYGWEYRQALSRTDPETREVGGSMRISADELAALGLPAPRAYPVPANTLVIADVRGFHSRGIGKPGSRRLAIHASLRMWPFSPLAY